MAKVSLTRDHSVHALRNRMRHTLAQLRRRERVLGRCILRYASLHLSNEEHVRIVQTRLDVKVTGDELDRSLDEYRLMLSNCQRQLVRVVGLIDLTAASA